MFKKKKADVEEISAKEKPEKGSKKNVGIGCLTIIIIALLLSMCGKGDDFKDAEIIDIMNGANTKSVGKTSVIKAKSTDVDDDYLLKWNKKHVQPNKFNWAVIVYTDKGDDNLGVYAADTLMIKDIRLSRQENGSYRQNGNTRDTVMYTVDGDKLIKDKIGTEADGDPLESKPNEEAKSSQDSNKSKKYDRELVTKTLAQSIIEEKIEKQRMKGFAPSSNFTVAKYSDKPIKDNDGNEYPISYMVSGQYEEKGTGALRDFVMCIAYKSEDDLDNKGYGYCLQYVNQDTNKYFNNVAKEDDIFEKLKDLNNK